MNIYCQRPKQYGNAKKTSSNRIVLTSCQLHNVSRYTKFVADKPPNKATHNNLLQSDLKPRLTYLVLRAQVAHHDPYVYSKPHCVH